MDHVTSRRKSQRPRSWRLCWSRLKQEAPARDQSHCGRSSVAVEGAATHDGQGSPDKRWKRRMRRVKQSTELPPLRQRFAHDKHFRSHAVFPVSDLEDCKLVVIRADWGHRDGNGHGHDVAGWRLGGVTLIWRGHMVLLEPPGDMSTQAMLESVATA